MANILVDQVKNFVANQGLPQIVYPNKENIDPSKFITCMKSLGLFGLNIPKEYGGQYVDQLTSVQVVEALADGWLTLCEILVDHMRVCDYLVKFGTDKQKNYYLPLLANGNTIAAQANMDDHDTKSEAYRTFITRDLPSTTRWLLSGRTEWVGNAKHANLFSIPVRVIPALHQVQSAIVLVSEHETNEFGTEDNWKSADGHPNNLRTIFFKKFCVETNQVVGEFTQDGQVLVDSAKICLFMASSACFIGSYQLLINQWRNYLIRRKQDDICGTLSKQSIVQLQFDDLVTKFEAIKSLHFDRCSKLTSEPMDINSSTLTSCTIYFSEIAQLLASLWITSTYETDFSSKYQTDEDIRERDRLSVMMADISANSILINHLGKQFRKHKHFDSMILKYSFRISPPIDFKNLLCLSMGEQEQIIDAGYYRYAHLYLYDMTTMNPTQTFKDYIGCLTLAYCLQNNISCFCLQSSGNTAMSVIHYARQTPQVKIIVFYMEKNAYKIDSHNLPQNITLVQVNSTEKVMRQIVKRFSDLTNIMILPNDVIQMNANKLRANYLNDNYIKKGVHFDWLVQSLSGAHGPIGLYQGFTEIESTMKVPKLLGVQQEAICPYVKIFCNNKEQNTDATDENISILEPTLFRTEPGPELIAKMKHILDTYGGKLKMLTNKQYYQYSSDAIKLLADNSKHLTTGGASGNQLQEIAGLLSVAAVLHEVDSDNGVITKDQAVLICVTGGTRAAPKHLPVPKMIIDHTTNDEQLQHILN